MKRKTHKEFVTQLNGVNPNIEVIGEYQTQREKILVKGRNCGHTWKANPYDLLKKSGCPQCRYIRNGKIARKTRSEFEKDVHKNNPNIVVIGNYSRSSDIIAVKCKTCGYEWTPVANSLVLGHGCPNCVGLRNKTADEFRKELKRVNPFVNAIEEYVNNRTKLTVQCDNCKHIWKASPKTLLRGHGCPECNKVGTSFMEQFIFYSFVHVLGEENVLNRDKEKIGKELDIYSSIIFGY